MGKIERAQDQGVEHAEYDRVGANGKGQSDDRGEGEARRFAQQAEAEAGVLEEGFEQIAAEGFVGFLAVALIGAELHAGAALGGCAIDAGALQIFRALQDVGTEFLVHFLGGAGAAEKFRRYGTKPGEERHAASS